MLIALILLNVINAGFVMARNLRYIFVYMCSFKCLYLLVVYFIDQRKPMQMSVHSLAMSVIITN